MKSWAFSSAMASCLAGTVKEAGGAPLHGRGEELVQIQRGADGAAQLHQGVEVEHPFLEGGDRLLEALRIGRALRRPAAPEPRRERDAEEAAPQREQQRAQRGGKELPTGDDAQS